jgi:GTP cyclohydrolase FolE2
MLKGRDFPQQLWLPSRSGEQRLSDIQNTRDHRNINIDKVGVKNIRYPITVLDRAHGRQQTVANINMYVNLPKEFKGTHMSRFIEILNEYHGEIHIRNFATILETMKNRLQAESAHLEITFPYFIEKKISCFEFLGANGVWLPPEGISKCGRWTRPGCRDQRPHYHSLPLL